MNKRVLLAFILLLTVFSGCSKTAATDPTSENAPKNKYEKETFDFFNADKETRVKLSLDLSFSPNGKHYFILDRPGTQFYKVYLKEKDKQEKEILDYTDFFGEAAAQARDMNEYYLSWGGMSDRVFMYSSYSDILKFFTYMLDSNKWESVDVSYLKGYKILKAINLTNNLLVTKDGLFYSVNMTDKQIIQLDIPANSLIHDQNEQQVLFTNLEATNDSELCRLGIYDLDKDTFRFIDTKNPISRDRHTYFIPNSTNNISYLTEIEDKNGYVSSYLVIYDLVSQRNELIRIGDGPQSFLGWDSKGQSFYGVDYIMKKKRPF